MEDSTEFCKNCKRNISAQNFASHSAFCERRIRLCEVCDNPVQISEFKEHEEEYHAITTCEKCDKVLQKWMLPKHEESCEKRLVACEFCEAEFPYDAYSEHTDFCGSRTEKCTYCQKYIMMKEKEVHYKAHRAVILKMKDIKDEVQQNSVNEVISKAYFAPEADKKSQNSTQLYGSCQICKECVRWVDMSNHMKACAIKSGKCFRCGGSVHPNELKDHIIKCCSKLKKEFSPKDSKECSRCGGNIPVVELRDHFLKYCPKLNKEFSDKGPEKCPHCGHYVPSNELKDHFLKFCPKFNKVSAVEEKIIVAESNRDNESSASKYDSSKHYGVCHICKERIRWVDMNTHLPTCASRSGKCSRCGATVSANEIKEHMLKYCPRLKKADVVEPGEEMMASGRNRDYKISAADYILPEEDQLTMPCPYCGQICDTERILEHTRNCEQNTYECPLCLKIFPEKDRKMHESFTCKILLDINSTSGSYLGTETTQSYAGSVKKIKGSGNKESNSNSGYSFEACPLCRNSFPLSRIQEHVNICQKDKKPCKFCGKFIKREQEKSHLKNCPDIDRDVPRYSSRQGAKSKGAVPKYSGQANVEQKEESTPCNQCSVCGSYVPITDIESHENQHRSKCCHKKGKKCSCEIQRNEASHESSAAKIWRQVKSTFSGRDSKDSGFQHYGENYRMSSEYQSTYTPHKQQPAYTPHKYQSSYSSPVDESLYSSSVADQEAFDPIIPCEFCDQTFPMSEIVLHSTGCKPDLVSFTSKNSHTSEDVYTSKSNSHQQKRSVTTNNLISSEETPFFPGVTSASPSRYEHSKPARDSFFRPGEFLAHSKDNGVKNIHKYENAKPGFDQAQTKDHSKRPNVVALWNYNGTSKKEFPPDEINEYSYVVDDKKATEISLSSLTEDDEKITQRSHSSLVKDGEAAIHKLHYSHVKDDEKTVQLSRFSYVSDDERSAKICHSSYLNVDGKTTQRSLSSDVNVNVAQKSFFSHPKEDENIEAISDAFKASIDDKDDMSVYFNFISNERVPNVYGNDEELVKHKSNENIPEITNKEVSNLYEEEEPKMHKDSDMEHKCLELAQPYSSKVKQTSFDSDSESESLDSVIEALEMVESKKQEDFIRMQLHIEKDKINVCNAVPENIDSDKEKYVSRNEPDMMDVDVTLFEDIDTNKQSAFKIEPAVQSLSLNQKTYKKTWKIESSRNKTTDEVSPKGDITKQCLANFRFASNRNATDNANKMDCDDSSKDENENKAEKPVKIEPAQKNSKNGISRDKIAANFYECINESHGDFVAIAQRRMCGDQKRNAVETNEERPTVNEWIKKHSRRSSDSE